MRSHRCTNDAFAIDSDPAVQLDCFAHYFHLGPIGLVYMSVCLLLINTKLSAKPRSSYLTDSPHCESLGLLAQLKEYKLIFGEFC
ncbi:hypothetical protein BpHYR1_025887 [Brachionus plicatilis]|uniref:Uncharacterized protein n=1 Tax=Brachionus plicatilis TaxID=10195 RepID=A0A3M7Q233_BRAPC|nr:hypothetical protein BpHYR1_025887 [Brachionus plicatilis]